MKKLLVVALVACCAPNAFTQGTIVFNNRVVNSVVAPIYAPDPADPTLRESGQSGDGFPAGDFPYGGAALSGTGLTAQLWGAPGANQPESSLQPAAGYSTAGFRTGAAAGFWATSPDAAIIPGAAEGTVATLQVRVWDNRGGTITTWQAAQATLDIPSGASTLFNSLPLGGISVPPNLVGLVSFNIAFQVIPEPSASALCCLGFLLLSTFFRRSTRDEDEIEKTQLY
jgi:hypothetical protein